MIKKMLFLSLVCLSLLSLSACSVLPKESTEESTQKKKKNKKNKKEKSESAEEDEENEEDEEVDNSDFEFLDFGVSQEAVNNVNENNPTYKRLNLKSSGYEKISEAVDRINDKVSTGYYHNSQNFFDYNNYTVSRADNRVVSFLSSQEMYDDSANVRNIAMEAHTYESKTGKELDLSDVMELDFDFDEVFSEFDFSSLVQNTDEFKSMLESLIANEASGNSDYKKDAQMAWTLGYNGVSLYVVINDKFSSGYIGADIVQFDIPYSTHPELYKKKYVANPDKFSFAIPLNDEFYFDIDADNKPDHISFHAVESPEWSIQEYSISINGEVTTIPAYEEAGYATGVSAFVKTENGNYLMFNETGNNDGRIIRILDLNTLSLVPDEEIFPYLYFPHDVMIAYNPDKMILEQWIYTVSTLHVTGEYAFKNDTLEALSGSYQVMSPLIFTSKIDLNVDVISDNGDILETATIPTGTQFVPYETDIDSYVDYRLLDGRIVRLPVGGPDESSMYGYPHTINGMQLDDVFDGILFAG